MLVWKVVPDHFEIHEIVEKNDFFGHFHLFFTKNKAGLRLPDISDNFRETDRITENGGDQVLLCVTDFGPL